MVLIDMVSGRSTPNGAPSTLVHRIQKLMGLD
ncbi:hypothetical protein A2U01_0057397, partial [Trifolium medium]|nr:hypothetical protein [Trifolium medium]